MSKWLQSKNLAGHVTRSSASVRWILGLGAASVVIIAVVLLFLLTVSTNNRAQYENTYGYLLTLNIVVAGLLLVLIGFMAVRLIIRLRQGKFGSQLLVKLALIFSLVGFAPGLLIYVVSYQFVSRSIESWFDVKVESALDAGLNLGRVTLDVLSSELANDARAAASRLSGMPEGTASLELERIREQMNAQDVQLWSSSGQLIASAGEQRYKLGAISRPTAVQMRKAKSLRVTTSVEGLDEGAGNAILIEPANTPNAAKINALATVENTSFGISDEPRYLQISQLLPPNLVSNALAVTQANAEYQNRALAREGLRRMYIGTLTLSLFLAVFSAVLLAVFLGAQLAAPLLLLADGVRQVAAGDLAPKAMLQSKDELGGLTRSFALMTQQLADARSTVESSMAQVNTARENLQVILDNLTSGVIVMDPNGVIQSCNPGAARILQRSLENNKGQTLESVTGLEKFAQGVKSQFDAFLSERQLHHLDHWQHSFELNSLESSTAGNSPFATHQTITLIARGAELPSLSKQSLRLLVFDDISDVVSSQRALAWGDVARRLAHEIKNPLTPIQLSAQRLEKKLSGKVAEPEQLVLTKSVKTIVDQVEAMKRLVNEFRDYARLPAAELKPVNLNALILDVLQLYGADETQPRWAKQGEISIEAMLDEACPNISGDAQQLRQVIHNLLQNAVDATLSTPVKQVKISSQWNPETQRVRMVVSDSGAGFPEHILKRAFEPYVTTKHHGTGLGLAVVKKIADEHHARLDISNRVTNETIEGAQISLSFALS
ncbi:MAG TPA: ATP-binding protein [Burkholderiaceae bacterium]|nr:ATP-binding protein [Burkholderiaceae bacterium]